MLLGLARASIKGEVGVLEKIPDKFNEMRGVFVTLTKNGQLCGCIGNIEPVAPMYKAVIDCARCAAYEDYRFEPLQKSEIGSLKIEISVLSKLEKLNYLTPDDLLEKLNENLGVVVQRGVNKATFLPQVWEELPNKREFLDHLCMKAGMRPDEWKHNELSVLVYTVEKFCEDK